MTSRLPRIVYLVDDDDAVRDSLHALLETYGLHVEDYASGAQFLSKPRDFNGACLILDIHMPGMTGIDLLNGLKRRNVVPVAIAITGAGDAVMRDKLKQLGVSAVLDKPVADDILMRTIESAFAD